MRRELILGAALLILAVPGFAWGYGQMTGEAHEQIEAALEGGDYQEWLSLRESLGLPMRGMASQITEETFPLMQEMHEAMESEDFDRAAEIRAEFGFGLGNMHKSGGQANRGGNGGFRDGGCIMGG